jgi:hypothetical protein
VDRRTGRPQDQSVAGQKAAQLYHFIHPEIAVYSFVEFAKLIFTSYILM